MQPLTAADLHWQISMTTMRSNWMDYAVEVCAKSGKGRAPINGAQSTEVQMASATT